MTACDVAIAGAGPSGALTAILLARARPDLRLALLDADPVPRHRPCGEFLAPGGVACLRRHGLGHLLDEAGAWRLDGLDLCAGSTRTAVAHAGGGEVAPVGCRRERLDAALQREAARAVDVRRGEAVQAIAREDGRWRLRLAGGRGLDCRLLIGADGRDSRVRHLAGLDRPQPRRRLGLACRLAGMAHGGGAEMHLGALGQVGICPLGPGQVNVNLLLAPSAHGLLRRLGRTGLLRAALATTPGLRRRSAGAGLGPVLATPSLAVASTAVAADGLCLVGDAAGTVDPFLGSGITTALLGAESLAACLATMLRDGMPGRDRLAAWPTAWRRITAPLRRLDAVVQPLLSRRRAAEAVTGVLSLLPAIRLPGL